MSQLGAVSAGAEVRVALPRLFVCQDSSLKVVSDSFYKTHPMMATTLIKTKTKTKAEKTYCGLTKQLFSVYIVSSVVHTTLSEFIVTLNYNYTLLLSF